MTVRWEIVQVAVRCAYGCQVLRGDAAAFGPRRFVLCKKHAGGYGLRPPRNLKKTDETRRREQANARDGKLRQMPVSER